MIKNFSICSRDYYIGSAPKRLAMTRENFHIRIRAIARDRQPATAHARLSFQHIHFSLFPGIYLLSNGKPRVVSPKWFNL